MPGTAATLFAKCALALDHYAPISGILMSACGTKRRSRRQMSAFGGKADIVRFVLISPSAALQWSHLPHSPAH